MNNIMAKKRGKKKKGTTTFVNHKWIEKEDVEEISVKVLVESTEEEKKNLKDGDFALINEDEIEVEDSTVAPWDMTEDDNEFARRYAY